jgi:hypothetical protein
MVHWGHNGNQFWLFAEAHKMKTKTLTKEEVKKRVCETTAEVFANIFNMSEKAATEKIRTSLKESLDEDALIQAAFIHFLHEFMKSGIKRSKGRRCTEEELQLALSRIRASAPALASALRKSMKDTQRQLPRHGGPGRTEILTASEKLEVCDQISSLVKLGKIKRMPEIFEVVANTIRATKHKHVSARTVKRAWVNRATLYAG